MNAQKARDETSTKPTAAATPLEESNSVKSSKKRKADDENSDEDSRKRTKGGQRVDHTSFTSLPAKRSGTPPDDRIDDTESQAQEVASLDADSLSDGVAPHNPPTKQPLDPDAAVDEDEWAAFQREIASPPPEPSALTAAADISAAPITAAELAAQWREQASRQAKERAEAEVEGEKEDAARQLEEEFEEMAGLEDRVRRLREKREKLRVWKGEGVGEEGVVVEEEARPPEKAGENGFASAEASSESDENEWGAW
ncbi:MAG: hypothetical protein LQ343_003356 [Gyalolechia ehrenbergii]|nr:MAG: hypothetical protein LQ343_003356 [Gyalolechia ehrenbergii]